MPEGMREDQAMRAIDALYEADWRTLDYDMLCDIAQAAQQLVIRVRKHREMGRDISGDAA